MTHDTDCNVREEYVEHVDRIANLIWNGEMDEAEEEAKNLGWNYIGGGRGRSVFRVAGEQQIGRVENATHEAPCVVKFAEMDPNPNLNGLTQNEEEAEQYKSLPAELKESGPDEAPMVVPVSDHHPQYVWLSMPEVKARGGSVSEMKAKLKGVGWEYDDLHDDNVGEMHGESVILDYGLELGKDETAMIEAEDLAENLRDERCEDVTINDAGDGSVDVYFYPPEWVLDGERPPEESVVAVGNNGMITFMELNFGGYDAGTVDEVDDYAEDVADEIISDLFGVNVIQRVHELAGVTVAEFEITPSGTDDSWPQLIVTEMITDVFDIVHNNMPGGATEPLPGSVGRVGGKASARTQAEVETEADIEAAVEEEVNGS